MENSFFTTKKLQKEDLDLYGLFEIHGGGHLLFHSVYLGIKKLLMI